MRVCTARRGELLQRIVARSKTCFAHQLRENGVSIHRDCSDQRRPIREVMVGGSLRNTRTPSDFTQTKCGNSPFNNGFERGL